MGEFAGELASALVTSIGLLVILPVLVGTATIDAIAGTSSFQWVNRRIVRGYIDRAARVVGRVVEKTLSDPKLLAIIGAALISCAGTALGAAVLAPACAYAGSLALKGVIAAGIAASASELEPLIGETAADLAAAGAQSYADTHTGQTPPPPTLSAIRSDALEEARRIYRETAGAAVENAGKLLDKVTAPALAALSALPVADLRASLPDIFAPVLAVGRLVAAAGASAASAADGLTVATRGALDTAARALVRRPAEWDRIVGGMRAHLAALRAQAVAWAIDDAAAVAVSSVPALTTQAARLRAAGLRIDGPAEGAAGRAYLDAVTRDPGRSPGMIAATAPIWTVESIGRGRVGPLSAGDALRAQVDAIAESPRLAHVRAVLAGNDRARAARGGAHSFAVGPERLRLAVTDAIAAAPQAPRTPAEIAARIGPDVARRLGLSLDAPPALPATVAPRDRFRVSPTVRPLIVPPVITPRTPSTPEPPAPSAPGLSLPLLAAAGLLAVVLLRR